MKWIYLNTGFGTGKFNMDFDIELTKTAERDCAVLRLYQWNPYCISLGANQEIISINSSAANEDGIDVVKRPTGGRAILHAEELTYSVVYPLDEKTSPKQLYREINLALKEGLIFYEDIFDSINLENDQPYFPGFYKDEKSTLCFAVSAKSELNFHKKKIVGSAQRKMGNFVLQHGSILCGDFHKKILNYLNINSDNFEKLKTEIYDTTTEMESVTGKKTDFNKLIESVKKGFEQHFNMKLQTKEIDNTIEI